MRHKRNIMHDRQIRLNNNSNKNNVDLPLLPFNKTCFTLVIDSIYSTATYIRLSDPFSNTWMICYWYVFISNSFPLQFLTTMICRSSARLMGTARKGFCILVQSLYYLDWQRLWKNRLAHLCQYLLEEAVHTSTKLSTSYRWVTRQVQVLSFKFAIEKKYFFFLKQNYKRIASSSVRRTVIILAWSAWTVVTPHFYVILS